MSQIVPAKLQPFQVANDVLILNGHIAFGLGTFGYRGVCYEMKMVGKILKYNDSHKYPLELCGFPFTP